MRFLLMLLAIAAALGAASVPESLRSNLTLHATFDKGADADTARGDRHIYHAPDYKQQAAAKPGIGDVDAALEKGALRFRSKNTRALFFKGDRHVALPAGAISFWLRVDPQKELAPGFTDPIQITDKAYNDSGIWVDFTKDDVPRKFRLGVFGVLKTWNPKNLPSDKNPDFMQRLVVVENPPFTSDKWTHIVVTWSGLQSPGGSASLFVNGKVAPPAKKIAEAFEWDPARVAIRLGVNFIGLMDELATFDRALNEKDVAALYKAGQ